jgi:hypothetical protein
MPCSLHGRVVLVVRSCGLAGCGCLYHPQLAAKYFALRFVCCQLRYKLLFCDFPQSGKRTYITLYESLSLLALRIDVFCFLSGLALLVRPSMSFHNGACFLWVHSPYILTFLGDWGNILIVHSSGVTRQGLSGVVYLAKNEIHNG